MELELFGEALELLAECDGQVGGCESYWLSVFLTFQLDNENSNSKFKKTIKELKKAIQVHPHFLKHALHVEETVVSRERIPCKISFTPDGGLVGDEVNNTKKNPTFFCINVTIIILGSKNRTKSIQLFLLISSVV